MRFWLVRIVSIVLAVGFALAVPYLVGNTFGEYSMRLAVLGALFVTLAVSLNLINGITGQFSIGHAAFYMIGAYSTAFVTNLGLDATAEAAQKGVALDIPVVGPVLAQLFYWFSLVLQYPVGWLVAMMVVGAAAAGVAGFLVGLPTLRLRGDYLAIVTLGFGEIIRILVQSRDELGGAYGYEVGTRISQPWLAFALAILCIAVCRNLLRSSHGLQFLSVREDELAAKAMGINVTGSKVTAFIIGAAFAGAAGAIFAHFEKFIAPQMFAMDVSFIILTMVVLGGSGSITGSAVAALLLFGIPEAMRQVSDAEGNPLTITGAGLVALLLAVVATVAMFRYVILRVHVEGAKRALYYAGAVVAAVLIGVILRFVFTNIPGLAGNSYEIGQLRMVVFAGALITIMLLRPQGMFAHHEFSWDWVRSLFGRRSEARA
ncbi:MAG: branched-chain amino acid ABC transporter permease [Fimbriimonadaceae bacterium]